MYLIGTGWAASADVDTCFFFSSRRRHTRCSRDWSSDVCSSDLRRLIIKDLTSIGLEVEAGHHEVAPAQHEIDFQYAEALQTADNLATFRFIVRNVAYRHAFLATFMPKPIFGQNVSEIDPHPSLLLNGPNT